MQNARAGKTDFYRSAEDEPHAARRREILKAHPEIEQLYGPDHRPVPIVIAMVVGQITLACFAKYMSWPVYFLLAYIFGGTVTHSLSLMTHESSHNLIFRERALNEWFGIFCNIGMGIPASVTFKRFHMEHHQYQGRDGIDVDVPTMFEGKYFSSTIMKFLFLFLMPFAYGARPNIVRPKSLSTMELCNYIVVVGSNTIVTYFAGWQALSFIALSLYCGHSLHPMAGHFIAEHYVFQGGYETFSYYGPLNVFAWNVGYHNEHHDFPKVAGWRLPQVKAMAPEFYDHLPCYNSWTHVLWQFIVDPNVGPYSRVVRSGDKSQPYAKECATFHAANTRGHPSSSANPETTPISSKCSDGSASPSSVVEVVKKVK